MLRQFLIFLRKQYDHNKKNFLIFLISGLFLFSSAVVVFDVFFEFSGVWNIMRAIILLPLSVSMFSVGYVIAYYLHKRRVTENKEWVPLRLRLSANWRRRLSALVFAFLIVFMYANKFSPVYTLISGVFVALVIMLFAFMRVTNTEKVREDLNIPDMRDIRYENKLKKREQEKKEEKNEEED